MKKRTKRFAALAAIGMMGSLAYGLSPKFTWQGACDCTCWTEGDCWSYVGDPLSTYPAHSIDDAIISSPPRSIILDTNGNLTIADLQLHTSVHFYKDSVSGYLTVSSLEIAYSTDVEITVDDVIVTTGF